MMVVLDVANAIQVIYKIANAIYEVVEGVKTNRNQCRRLSTRIKIIVEAIAKLDQYPDTTEFSSAIDSLEQTLKGAHEFILKFTQQKTWVDQALKVDKNTKEFSRFNRELQQASSDLNLTILATQIVIQTQDSKDQQADKHEMKQLQSEIIEGFQKNQQEWKKFIGTTKERDSLILQQLQSVKWQLKKLQCRDGESKSMIPPEDEIPFFELSLDRVIGEGGISTVYAGKWAGQDVAIKLLLTPLSGTEGLEFVREIQILRRIHSPLVVSFYGACLEDNRACLVMEYLSGGSLYDYLPKNRLTMLQKQRIAAKVAEGLQFLHKKECIHGDLRSANILLTDALTPKISNFGLSQTRFYSIQSLEKISPGVACCAPEILSGEKINDKSDIFSLGTILWELFTGKRPFADLSLSDQIDMILTGKYPALTSEIPEEFRKIITGCWCLKPAERPRLDEIISQINSFKPGEFIYQRGKAAERVKDYKKAAEHYREASELKLPAAMTSMATLILKGWIEDKPKAYLLLLAAAEAGHKRATLNLAIQLDRGDGIPKDWKNASYWYRRAGDPESLKRAEYLEKKLSLS